MIKRNGNKIDFSLNEKEKRRKREIKERKR